MRRQATYILLSVLGFAGGCNRADDPNNVLSTHIEHQLVVAHPDVRLERFARFYTRDKNGSVRAIYIFANEGYDPIVGKAGTVTWTSLSKLPVVDDGGCSILNIQYVPGRKETLEVTCNGDA